jgi:hypothetical protein
VVRHEVERKDGGTPGLAHTLSRSHLGQVALRREQLESKRHANRATGMKVRPITDSQAQPADKMKWQYACRLFGMNSLKAGEMWHIDLLPISDSVNSSRC